MLDEKEFAQEVIKGISENTEKMVTQEIEKRLTKSEMAKRMIGGDVTKSVGTDVEKAYKDEFIGSYIKTGREVSKAIGDLNGTTTTAGGYTLPKNMAASIVEKIKQDSPILNYATTETISMGNSLDVVVEGDTAFGSGWIAETGSRINTQEGDFKLVQIPVYECYANPSTTRALLMDSAYDIENYITTKTAESMALTLGTAFVNGNGTTKPTGIFDSVGGLPVGQKTTSTAATAITYKDIISLIYSLKTKYAQNGMFFMNRKVKGYVQGIVDAVSGQPIFRESAIVGEPPTMLGYPVVEVEDMDSTIVAGKNTILFGDMAAAYRIVLHTDTGMLRDDYTKKGFVQFYTYMRVGGKLVQPEALVYLTQHA